MLEWLGRYSGDGRQCGAPIAIWLSDPKRPNGSFLFLGPTGVGKTELCKSLAEFLFDSEDAWFGLICPNSWRNIQLTVGAPPGYVDMNRAVI